MRLFFVTVALMLLQLGPCMAQPRTPTVYVNRQFRLVEIAKSQRATLTFDLRPIRGEHLQVKLYRHDQTAQDKPLKEWLFHSSTGSKRISFEDLPISVYTLVAYCSNEAGEPLAYAAPPINVNYGGWRSWEEFRPPVETVESKPVGFEEVSPATNTGNRDVRIGIDPPAVVMKPGGSVNFRAGFHNIEPEPVKWKLVGEGKLKLTGDGSYTYIAPSKQVGTKLFRVEIQSAAHPDLKGSATILVTDADQDKL